MSDLFANCPKCNKWVGEYFHYVDHCGMGVEVPSGEYTLHCKKGYYNKEPEEAYCGNVFKVRVGSRTVEVF